MPLLTQVRDAIAEHHLFPSGSRVLVAVSGGADSVALLLALNSLAPQRRLTLAVAHLDHGIRGQAAREDATFVERLARRLKVSCFVGKVDVPALARGRRLSVEMAAREARYDYLARVAKEWGADAVATAHTADDQAETVLLKLARGAGPRGMAGIPRAVLARGMRVVRPLLEVRRSEIERWLKARRQGWRTDESNRDMGYLRNRVRHQVLPLLEKTLNPSIREGLCRAAALFRDEDTWVDEMCRSIFRQCADGAAIRMDGLLKWPVAARRRVVRLWLAERGFPVDDLEFATVERVMDLSGAATGSINLAGRWKVTRRGSLMEASGPLLEPSPFVTLVNVPGRSEVPGAGLVVDVTLASGVVKDRTARPGVYPVQASVSGDKVGRRRVVVRSWKPGDRIRPLGMKGSKKLQDVFTDLKVPLARRASIPVFECAGEIIWVPGYRVARGWEVQDPRRCSVQLNVAERVSVL